MIAEAAGLFPIESAKELTAYGALIVIVGFAAYKVPKVIEKMLETFKSEIAAERERCDKQMVNERERADEQLAARDQRYDRIVDVLERLERKA